MLGEQPHSSPVKHGDEQDLIILLVTTCHPGLAVLQVQNFFPHHCPRRGQVGGEEGSYAPNKTKFWR